MRAVWEARRKIVGVGAIILLALLMMNLNSRLSEYFRLSNERNQLSTEVANLEATRLSLETQEAYATSDQAVEDWARVEGRRALPDDKIVVLLTPVGQTSEQQSQPEPTQTPVANWEIWWALFFSN